MKRTLRTELFRSIKGTLPTYLSILILVFFAVFLFIGIGGTDVVMSNTLNETSERYLAYDYRVIMPYGFSEQEIERLSELGAAEGYHEACAFFDHGDQTCQIRLTSIGKRINVPFEMEGELPKNGDELALAKSFAKKYGLSIGQKITLDMEDGTARQVTVCGFMESCAYIGTSDFIPGFSRQNSSVIHLIGYASDAFFDGQDCQGYYLRLDQTGGKSVFDDEYKQLIHECFDPVRLQAEAVNEERYQDLGTLMQSMGMDAPEKLSPVITSRLNDIGYNVQGIVHSILSQVKWTMALIFVLVGLFVCYFSISRLVSDSAPVIGNKLALGFSTGEITRWYLSYTVLAVVPGILLGIPVGVWIIESIIKYSVAPLIVVTRIGFAIDPADVLLIIAVELGFLGLVTVLACRRIVKREILQLLSNSSEETGKTRIYQKMPFWKEISIFSKAVINNTFNEKKRVLATVISIASCTMLIISSFTLLFNSIRTREIQYSKIQNFDRIAFLDPSAQAPEEIRESPSCLGVHLTQGMLYKTNADMSPESYSTSVMLFATEDERIRDFAHFYSADSGVTSHLNNGIAIPDAMARYLQLQPGDSVTVIDSSAQRTEWTVDCIYEDYSLIFNTYVSKRVYEEKTQKEYPDNAVLFDSGDANAQTTEKMLTEASQCYSVLDYITYADVAFQIIIRLMKVVVLIYLFASVSMAVFVCNNLLKMYISEKKRDMIILLMNGYNEKTVRKYIITDTVINAALGVIISVFIGYAMGILSIRTFFTNFTTFITSFNVPASIIGAVGMTGIMTVISIQALKQTARFDLTDIT